MQIVPQVAIVAGPCAAESEAQVMACARALAAGVRLTCFRAGVWKPRTRPGHFEGRGEEALPWLARVARELHVPVCTEVATAEHAALAKRYGIDSFWVGARTTADPFAVQALAEAMGSVRGTVYVKNPPSPDLDLWIGAMERFRRAGAERVVAVHRGFYPFAGGRYRNAPRWDTMLMLRARRPDLPIYCDPSHIAGKRELVPEVAHQAMLHAADGLFVEVHPNPAVALSDARQQLLPAEFIALVEALPDVARRQLGCEDEDVALQLLRSRIDSIDNQLIELLAQRMTAVQEIGEWKAARHLSSFSRARWGEILRRNLAYSRELGMSPGFVRALAEMVHAEAIRLQDEQKEEAVRRGRAQGESTHDGGAEQGEGSE